MAQALAPNLGLDAEAATRAAEAATRPLALPVMERARKARRVWRELKLWLPEGEELADFLAVSVVPLLSLSSFGAKSDCP